MENDFRIRCSAIDQIVSGQVGLTDIQQARYDELMYRRNGNGKPLTPNMDNELDKLIYKKENPELPKGAKTYCETWVLEKKFNRRKDWSNKYVEKGLRVEETGIEMLSAVYNDGVMFEKNEQFFKDDHIQGTPDVISDIIYDVKCPWDLFKFPWFEDALQNDAYYWQVQGYMALTGKSKAAIAYCLIDTPKPLIEQELKKLYYQTGGQAEMWTPETYARLEENYKFNDIPLENRIKLFEVERNESDIALIRERVELCRAYIGTLKL